MNLAVEKYKNITAKEGRIPHVNDFHDFNPIDLNILVNDLNYHEVECLKILSIPNFLNIDIFNTLMNNFEADCNEHLFSKLNYLSFIDKDQNGNYLIHPHMRELLQENQDSNCKDRIHITMINYYQSRLVNICTTKIDSTHETFLVEAFYHRKAICEVDRLYKWFLITVENFYKKGFWDVVLPLFEDMLKILESQKEHESLEVAHVLEKLGKIYSGLSRDNESVEVYKRALSILNRSSEKKVIEISIVNKDLARVYERMGNYAEALEHSQLSLRILENTLGKENETYASALNIFAEINHTLGKYNLSEENYEEAL